MNYLLLFSPHDLALLSDWLRETGELYVDVYRPHSGGGSAAYFIRSMNDFKSLISEQNWPEIDITIYRQMQFPVRGIANEELLERALQQIPDSEEFTIVSLQGYPSYCKPGSSGQGHEELRREFIDFLGQEVGIGQEPTDVYVRDAKWFHAHSKDVFRLSVTRTRSYYENYAKNPQAYQWLEDSWRE